MREWRLGAHVPRSGSGVADAGEVPPAVLGLVPLLLPSLLLAEMSRCCTCRRWPFLLDLQHSLYVLVCVSVCVHACVCVWVCLCVCAKTITVQECFLARCVFMKPPQGGFQRPLGTLRSPPCPFSRASYGEPGVRSTGHWCRLPTRLLPVSHGGCAGTGPTHDTLQPQFIHISGVVLPKNAQHACCIVSLFHFFLPPSSTSNGRVLHYHGLKSSISPRVRHHAEKHG